MIIRLEVVAQDLAHAADHGSHFQAVRHDPFGNGFFSLFEAFGDQLPGPVNICFFVKVDCDRGQAEG